MFNCVKCGESVASARWRLGFHRCLDCGEKHAKAYKHTIVPMHKSNYVPIFNLADLVGINSKSGNHTYL